MSKTTHADPLKTKTGKTRLGPLNIKQLYSMLEKETRAKNKGKIQTRICEMEKRGHKLSQEPVAESITETV
jgi:hypothetical protein